MGNWLKRKNCSWEWPAKFAPSQDSISQDKIAKPGISLPSPLAVCCGAIGLMNFESLHTLIAGSVSSWKSYPAKLLGDILEPEVRRVGVGDEFSKATGVDPLGNTVRVCWGSGSKKWKWNCESGRHPDPCWSLFVYNYIIGIIRRHCVGMVEV